MGMAGGTPNDMGPPTHPKVCPLGGAFGPFAISKSCFEISRPEPPLNYAGIKYIRTNT